MSKAFSSAVFTLRDLNRQPAKVLDAVRKFGRAEIRTRSGEIFTVEVKKDKTEQSQEFPDFASRWKKLRELGLIPPRPVENDRIDELVAGEG
jgi:hypothetical protein